MARLNPIKLIILTHSQTPNVCASDKCVLKKQRDLFRDEMLAYFKVSRVQMLA